MTVDQAIRSHSQLKIKTQGGLVFRVKPYKIESDDFSTRNYLIGYSKPAAQPDAGWRIASFRIPRCHDIKSTSHRFSFTKNDIHELEEMLQTRSIQFLLSEDETIRVYLTDNGIRKYNDQLYLRPAKDASLSTEHEYVFHCTQMQAEYYFFKFGEDAEVLFPSELRQKFQKMYQNAVATYCKSIIGSPSEIV